MTTRVHFYAGTGDTQEILRKFVEKNVVINQTPLVCKLQELSYEGHIEFNIDNEYVDRSKEIQELEVKIEGLKDMGEKEARDLSAEIEELQDEIDELDDEHGEVHEVAEWRLVNQWLLDRLRDEGEVTAECEGEERRGRQCSGQAIFLDRVIAKIYCDFMGIE